MLRSNTWTYATLLLTAVLLGACGGGDNHNSEPIDDGAGGPGSGGVDPITSDRISITIDGSDTVDNDSDSNTASSIALVAVAGGTDELSSSDAVNESGQNLATASLSVAGIYVSRFEVTQGQWRNLVVTSDAAVSAAPWVDIGDGFGTSGDDRPAYGLAIQDIDTVLSAWNARDFRWKFRLPTEHEWEFAARAASDGQWYWDPTSQDPADYAVAFETRGTAIGPQVAGSRQANAFGLSDTLGNVWEWVVAESGTRLLAGGSWNETLLRCQFANRLAMPSDASTYASAGLRLVIFDGDASED